MSKASEIEEWQATARRYREVALQANNRISRRMLNDLAAEADAMADDIGADDIGAAEARLTPPKASN